MYQILAHIFYWSNDAEWGEGWRSEVIDPDINPTHPALEHFSTVSFGSVEYGIIEIGHYSVGKILFQFTET